MQHNDRPTHGGWGNGWFTQTKQFMMLGFAMCLCKHVLRCLFCDASIRRAASPVVGELLQHLERQLIRIAELAGP